MNIGVDGFEAGEGTSPLLGFDCSCQRIFPLVFFGNAEDGVTIFEIFEFDGRFFGKCEG